MIHETTIIAEIGNDKYFVTVDAFISPAEPKHGFNRPYCHRFDVVEICDYHDGYPIPTHKWPDIEKLYDRNYYYEMIYNQFVKDQEHLEKLSKAKL